MVEGVVLVLLGDAVGVRSILGGEVDAADLLFADGGLVALLDRRPLCMCQRGAVVAWRGIVWQALTLPVSEEGDTYELGERVHLFVGRDKGRLDEELVLALCVGGRVGRQGLEDDWEWCEHEWAVDWVGCSRGGGGQCARPASPNKVANVDLAWYAGWAGWTPATGTQCYSL